MEAHFLNGMFNEQLIRSILTTLIHSLWMGALMALVAGMVILFTKRCGPHIRYQLLTGLLTLFIISTGYIFYNVRTTEAVVSAPGQDMPVVSVNTDILSPVDNSQQTSLASVVISFLQTHADIIVLVWFIIICLKCIRLISGLRILHLLRQKENIATPAYWNKRLSDLTAQLGITKPVCILQSYLAKVPMVIGHLKPIILFPVGVMNALPQNEVEAILLHELAHIKRNDFLINLLQQLAEIFFFFNPAVLWISALIKNERENCCDDIAIAITNDKKIFINALVAFQEYNNALPCAATFPGAREHLLNRVKRIITNNNQTLSNMEKVILSSGVVVVCMATLAFSPFQPKEDTTVKAVSETSSQTITAGNATTEEAYYQNIDDKAAVITYAQDTLPKKEKTVDTGNNMTLSGTVAGKKILLREYKNSIQELYVDGTKIPENRYAEYKPLIEKLHKQMKEEMMKRKMETEILKQKKQELQQQSEFLDKQADEMKIQSKIMQEELIKQKEIMNAQQLEMQSQRDTLGNIHVKKMQAEFIKQQELFKIKQVEFEKKLEDLKLQQQQLKQKIQDSVKVKIVSSVKPVIHISAVTAASPEIAINSVATTKMAISPTVSTSVNATSNIQVQPKIAAPVISVKPVISFDPVCEGIISDLEEANIITGRNNLSFRFTNEELIVNGVKQSTALHQKMLNKYLKKPGETISLSYSNWE